MVQTLKQLEPTARKEHTCMFCGGKIKVGEKYQRQTVAYDGTVSDFINHTLCEKVAHELNMFEECGDEGVNETDFEDYISQYVFDNHRNFMTKVWDEGWENLSTSQEVIKIAEELKIL